MKLRYVMSGSLMYSTEADCVPPIGSTVVLVTDGYKKGVFKGSLISFPVTADSPPIYDYSSGELEVSIDINQWVVMKAGTPPEDEEE